MQRLLVFSLFVFAPLDVFSSELVDVIERSCNKLKHCALDSVINPEADDGLNSIIAAMPVKFCIEAKASAYAIDESVLLDF